MEYIGRIMTLRQSEDPNTSYTSEPTLDFKTQPTTVVVTLSIADGHEFEA